MSREINIRHCPECAGTIVKQSIQDRLRKVCSKCGLILYEDPKVAAAAIVVKKRRVLLLKRARPPHRGYWCLPGGFVDRGETLEDATIREVFEETGLKGTLSGLFGLYSYSGYPVIVAIFSISEFEGHLKINEENTDARWFTPEDIPWEELAFPSATDALKTWRETLDPS